MGTDSSDLFAALAGAFATVLAAGIAATAAATVFTVGEILKIRQAKSARQTVMVEQLLAAWADVALVSAPRIRRPWLRLRVYPERIDVSVGITRLMAVLPRRDFEVISLQRRLNTELVAAPNDRERTSVSASASAALTVWLASRRRGRRYARWELQQKGETINFDGSRVRKAREPRRLL